MIIDGVSVIHHGFIPFDAELAEYVKFVRDRVAGDVTKIIVCMCDDGCVDISYTARGQSFERIRRITGYLTGDLNTWNNAKQAEERDRVKHVGGYQNENR